jgi:hypothetical protein
MRSGGIFLGWMLTPEDLEEIDRIVPPGAASGTRYPIGQMHRLNL